MKKIIDTLFCVIKDFSAIIVLFLIVVLSSCTSKNIQPIYCAYPAQAQIPSSNSNSTISSNKIANQQRYYNQDNPYNNYGTGYYPSPYTFSSYNSSQNSYPYYGNQNHVPIYSDNQTEIDMKKLLRQK